jgi:hypothetical protein
MKTYEINVQKWEMAWDNPMELTMPGHCQNGFASGFTGGF